MPFQKSETRIYEIKALPLQRLMKESEKEKAAKRKFKNVQKGVTYCAYTQHRM